MLQRFLGPAGAEKLFSLCLDIFFKLFGTVFNEASKLQAETLSCCFGASTSRPGPACTCTPRPAEASAEAQPRADALASSDVCVSEAARVCSVVYIAHSESKSDNHNERPLLAQLLIPATIIKGFISWRINKITFDLLTKSQTTTPARLWNRKIVKAHLLMQQTPPISMNSTTFATAVVTL